jgi:hypothetical protein
MAKVVKRSVSAGLGSRAWSEVAYVVERPTDEPGVIAFARYASREEAEEDASSDGPTRKWELDTDVAPERRGWRL